MGKGFTGKADFGSHDQRQLLSKCLTKAPAVAEVQEHVGWLRLWDWALDYGVKHTKGLQALSRLMSSYSRGKRPVLSAITQIWTPLDLC